VTGIAHPFGDRLDQLEDPASHRLGYEQDPHFVARGAIGLW